MITRKIKRTTFNICVSSTLFLLFTACTKYSDTLSTEPTLSDNIKTLEDSGVIPKLDRSSDIKGPDQNLNGVRDDIDAWISLVA